MALLPNAAAADVRFHDGVRSSFMPMARPSNTLTIRLTKVGTDFAVEKGNLQVCIKTGSATQKARNVPIERVHEIDGSMADAADLMVTIPAALRPRWWDRGQVAVVLPDGRFAGQDRFYMIGFVPTVFFSIVMMFIIGSVLKHKVAKGANGLVWRM